VKNIFGIVVHGLPEEIGVVTCQWMKRLGWSSSTFGRWNSLVVLVS